MTAFNNLGIAKKLGLGFGLCIAVSAVIGFKSISDLSAMDRSIQTIKNEDNVAVDAIGDIKTNVGLYRIRLYRFAGQGVTVGQDVQKVLADIAKAKAKVDEGFDQLDKAIGDAKDDRATNAKELRADWEECVSITGSVQPKLASLKPEKAFKLLDEAIVQFFKKKFNPQAEKTNDAVLARAKSVVEDADAQAVKAKGAIIVLTIFAALAGTGIGFWITRSIKRPVSQLAERLTSLATHCVPGLAKGMNAFASADLTVEITPVTTPIPYDAKDEVGQMATTFNEMLGKMHGAVASYNQARGQLAGVVQDVALAARQVQETSTGLAAATQQGGTASGEIAQASERLAMGASEASGVVEDLAQQIDGIQKGAAQSALQLETASRDLGLANEAIAGVAASAQGMAAVAQEGNEAVTTTIKAMDRVRAQVETSSQRVSELDQKGKQIGTIVKTIETIAEQTNLLALNAAIEAARAGEHGRGFAVVADEVRKLAEQASRATREIGELVNAVSAGVLQTVDAIQATSDEVTQGAEATDAAGGALAQIVEAAQAVALRAEEVAARSQAVNEAVSKATETAASTQNASETMASASRVVAGNITNVAATSEQTAAGAEELSATIEEIAASAQELSAMSESLDAMMAKFRLEVSAQPTHGKSHLRLAA